MFEITDNGFGMSAEMIENVTDPFCTTRTTRKVGLGIPLLRLAAERNRRRNRDNLTRKSGISVFMRNNGTCQIC